MTTRDILERYASILTYPTGEDPLVLIRELGEREDFASVDPSRYNAATNLQAQVNLLDFLEGAGFIRGVGWVAYDDGENGPGYLAYGEVEEGDPGYEVVDSEASATRFVRAAEAVAAGRRVFGGSAVAVRVEDPS